MVDDKFDPFSPEILHGSMWIMAWGLDLPMIEKFVLIRVLYFTDPNDPMPSLTSWCEVSLTDLASDVSATVLEVSRAVSALEAKGLIKVFNFGRLIGGAGLPSADLHITPLFGGVKELSLKQREERRGNPS